MSKEETIDRIPDPRLRTKGKHLMMATDPISAMRVSQVYFSREMAGRFSIGAGWGSAKGDAKKKDFALRYEAMLETKPAPMEPLPDGEQYELVRAVGVTLDITVKQADVSVQADVFSVSAAVQLGIASASYAVTVYCSDEKVMRALLPPDGDLSLDNYEAIIAGVTAAKAEIAKNPALVPQPYYRPRRLVSGVETEVAAGQSIAYAVRCLRKGWNVKDAADGAAENKLDAALVRLVYQDWWPEVSDEVNPPDYVRQRAEEWLTDSYSDRMFAISEGPDDGGARIDPALRA